MSLFLKVLALVFIAEMGDKTQFLMIAMASKYKVGQILIGVFAAILVLNGLAIGVGILLGGMLPVAVIGLIAGIAFLWFAYSSISDKTEEEHGLRSEGKKGAVFTVFGTFFLAELGDKTQLTALTLAADAGNGEWNPAAVLTVFLASSLALFAADLLGLLIGFFLGKTLPDGVFSWMSFFIFAVFGTVKLLGGLESFFGFLDYGKLYAILITAAACIILAGFALHHLITTEKGAEIINHEQSKKSKMS